MIAYRYIDKHAATVAAILDNTTMRNIIVNTPLEIKELYEQMTSPRTATLSDMPKHHDVLATQNALAYSLDKMDVLMERYRMAVEYMNWFEPAWNCLTACEQRILCEFYMSGGLRTGANARLREQLSFSRATIDRNRGKALAHLSLLLFGM